jgi:hypothetical protein
MIISLMWLTVNTPFAMVSGSGLCMQAPVSNTDLPGSGSEDNNPLNNTTEEKVPTSNNFSEEYLHHAHTILPLITVGLEYHKLKNADTYTAFHGELLVPPPNS